MSFAASLVAARYGLYTPRRQSTYTVPQSNSSYDVPPSLLDPKVRVTKKPFQSSSSITPEQSANAEIQPILSRQEKAEIANHPPDSFKSLKGYLEYPIYKALVEKPFNFTTMSAVQQEVLSLLPELADPTARGAAPREKAVPENAQDLEKDKTRRGERDIATDLLVKAKTGTGKTVAFLAPALEARIQDLAQEARDFKAANPKFVLRTVSSAIGMLIHNNDAQC